MADLQCAVRVLLVCPGAPAGALADQRVARVWSGSGPGETQAAERLAEQLGVTAVAGDGLESRFAAELEEIADTHRGETVVVVLPRDRLEESLAQLVAVPADGQAGREADAGRPLVLLGDSDGWVLEGPGALR